MTFESHERLRSSSKNDATGKQNPQSAIDRLLPSIRCTIFYRKVEEIIGNSINYGQVLEEKNDKEHWDLWCKNFKEIEIDIREMQLIYKGFTKNFGGEKTPSQSFQPINCYSSFIEKYNNRLNEYAKKVPLFNAQVDEYNATLSAEAPKIQKLQLPPKLEFLKTTLEDGYQRSNKRNIDISMPKEVNNNMSESSGFSLRNFKKVVRQLWPVVAYSTLSILASQTDAAIIYGDSCSIESTLVIGKHDPAFDELDNRLQRHFESVISDLMKRIAKDPCNPDLSHIELNFAPLPPGIQARAYSQDRKILLDPEQNGGMNPDHSYPEGTFIHELVHVGQNYSSQTTDHYRWLMEGMADYFRKQYAPENDNRPLPDLMPGHHYTDGYGVAANYLLWLEQNKSETIVDDLNRMLQNDSFTAGFLPQLFGQDSFSRLINQTVDACWEEYRRNRLPAGQEEPPWWSEGLSAFTEEMQSAFTEESWPKLQAAFTKVMIISVLGMLSTYVSGERIHTAIQQRLGGETVRQPLPRDEDEIPRRTPLTRQNRPKRSPSQRKAAIKANAKIHGIYQPQKQRQQREAAIKANAKISEQYKDGAV